MLFSTIDFVIFFILILSLLVLFKNRKLQHSVLLISSFFFFYYSNNYLILLLIFSIILDFYVGREIFMRKNLLHKKILLGISLVGNLSLLGFFKYADFGIEQINIIGQSLGFSEIAYLDIILPIGISFYTFQTISYTIDIYRGRLEPCKSFNEFALFVSFFPQLVAGPILRAHEFLPQLREKISEKTQGYTLKSIVLEKSNLKFGISLMAIGFFKKMFIADNLRDLGNTIFTDPIGLDSLSIMWGALGFGIQIYCDFSGYSDIAIGAARIMGFKIPLNFNKPYFATSPSDFWSRWHISLSSWLRDYLYIPLGGNKKSQKQTFVNLFTVMVIGGLWHGASWNFVIWGGIHGGLLVFQKLLQKIFPSLSENIFFKHKIGKLFSILLTQYFIFLAWIAFRVENTEHLLYSIQKYVFIDIQIDQFLQTLDSTKIPSVMIILFLILHISSYKIGNLPSRVANLNYKLWTLFLITVFTSIFLFYQGTLDFIYFRF
jgi:alginate O-acetyltransferase complex protein AlgI